LEVGNFKGIDQKTMISSSLKDVYKTFGIEAVRQLIPNEINKFMESAAPHPKHCLIYSDVMTYTGEITPINFDGIKMREKNNLLLRIGDAPKRILLMSARKNIEANADGLSGALIVGTTPKAGTCYSSIKINKDLVKKNYKSPDRVLEFF